MKFDKIAVVVFLAIGILFIVGSLNISNNAYGSTVGPKTFPLILGIILAILSLRLLYEAFTAKVKEGNTEKEKLNYSKFAIIFGAALGYAFFLEIIGYVVATFLFLVIAFQTMERGKIIYTLIISAVFSFGVYLFYVNLLGGALPKFPLFS
ncbi:tripartite tricarboxylate transporter TctB family protein [Lysinibacillus louembei]|uniref:Tripartite tricarboxylate transporter TctB family protein n=1 Tax=Lysinibacillus louembei TaxID=1470088 RepID=A0ABZ0RV89_9BACI|nr:tripartite tricarboxylate transporter TctB family protein [Lysinibacillus louembei]WPK12144.1 tripartite tricarboxylate transporter TctB family protein [Lysinibacillus louembei]